MTFRLAASPRVSILIGIGLTAVATATLAFQLIHSPTVSHSTQAQLFPGIDIPERDIPDRGNAPPAIDLEQSIPQPKITIEKELSPIIEQDNFSPPSPPVVDPVPEKLPLNRVQILACNDIFPASANLRIGPGDRQIGVIAHGRFVQIIGDKSGNYYPVQAEQYWVGDRLIVSQIEGWIHQCFLG